MIFQQTFEKITTSDLFKNFKENHPDAQLCAGFFILDFLSNDTKKSLDYKIDDKIFTFDLNDKDEIYIKEDKLMDLPDTPKLKEIKPETKVEVDGLKGLAGMQALEHGISAKFHKIIAVLQVTNIDGVEKQVWNLTCMLDQLIILNILIDSETGQILKFDRKSMMDMIKKQ